MARLTPATVEDDISFVRMMVTRSRDVKRLAAAVVYGRKSGEREPQLASGRLMALTIIVSEYLRTGTVSA